MSRIRIVMALNHTLSTHPGVPPPRRQRRWDTHHGIGHTSITHQSWIFHSQWPEAPVVVAQGSEPLTLNNPIVESIRRRIGPTMRITEDAPPLSHTPPPTCCLTPFCRHHAGQRGGGRAGRQRHAGAPRHLRRPQGHLHHQGPPRISHTEIQCTLSQHWPKQPLRHSEPCRDLPDPSRCAALPPARRRR